MPQARPYSLHGLWAPWFDLVVPSERAAAVGIVHRDCGCKPVRIVHRDCSCKAAVLTWLLPSLSSRQARTCCGGRCGCTGVSSSITPRGPEGHTQPEVIRAV